MQYSSRPVLVASAGSRPSEAGPTYTVTIQVGGLGIVYHLAQARTSHAHAHGQPLYRAANADDFAYKLQRQKRPWPRLVRPLGVPGAGQDLLHATSLDGSWPVVSSQMSPRRPGQSNRRTSSSEGDAPATSTCTSASAGAGSGRRGVAIAVLRRLMQGLGRCNDVIESARLLARLVLHPCVHAAAATLPMPSVSFRIHLYLAVAQ